MNARSTAELNHDIKSVTDIEDYFLKNKEQLLRGSLSQHLQTLLIEKKLKKADVMRGSLLGRAYIYQIFAGKKIPARDKLIALAFGLRLTEEEAQKMLKLSGNRELYARDARDALLLFALQRKMTIMDTNALLLDFHFAILDTAKE